MKNYRLRIYREKRDKIDELRNNLKLYHSYVRLNRTNTSIVQDTAHQVRLLLQTFIQSQAWPEDMQPMITELNIRYAEYPETCAEDTASKRQIIKRIDKTVECVRTYYQFWSEKTTQEARQASWIKTHFGHVLSQHFGKHASKEYIVEYDSQEGALHVFFGGRGNPLGPGHGHYKFRYKDKRLVFGRAPDRAGQ